MTDPWRLLGESHSTEASIVGLESSVSATGNKTFASLVDGKVYLVTPTRVVAIRSTSIP